MRGFGRVIPWDLEKKFLASIAKGRKYAEPWVAGLRWPGLHTPCALDQRCSVKGSARGLVTHAEGGCSLITTGDTFAGLGRCSRTFLCYSPNRTGNGFLLFAQRLSQVQSLGKHN